VKVPDRGVHRKRPGLFRSARLGPARAHEGRAESSSGCVCLRKNSVRIGLQLGTVRGIIAWPGRSVSPNAPRSQVETAAKQMVFQRFEYGQAVMGGPDNSRVYPFGLPYAVNAILLFGFGRRFVLRFTQRWTVYSDGMAMVPQATEKRLDHLFVAEKSVPVVVFEIGGNNSAFAIIPFLHQAEEDVALLGFERQISHLVDKQKVDVGHAVNQPAGAAVRQALVHLVE
jgi:hypothetical protein